MKNLKWLFALLMATFLTACQTPVEAPPSKAPHFTGAPIRLSVANIEVVEDYQSPAKAPYVEQTFNYPPAEIVKTWVNDRLKTGGLNARRVEITIVDASVKRTPLDPTPGVKGLFTNDQEARFDGTLQIEARLYEEGKVMSVAEVKANAQVSRTIAENATLVERDEFFDQLSLDLATKATQQLENNMRQFFAAYIM